MPDLVLDNVKDKWRGKIRRVNRDYTARRVQLIVDKESETTAIDTQAAGAGLSQNATRPINVCCFDDNVDAALSDILAFTSEFADRRSIGRPQRKLAAVPSHL